jgi:hypothetical protein
MNFVFNYLFYVVQLVLSPTERWGGARQFEGITGGSQWFVVAAIAAIIVVCCRSDSGHNHIGGFVGICELLSKIPGKEVFRISLFKQRP